ncbi:MAG: hypothetical protein AAF385_13000 [Pseudomonadota bacterium]
MISPDQAEQVTDSLLEPAKRELAAKQEKLKRRQVVRYRFHDAFTPAVVAAGVAIYFGDKFNNPFVATFICAVIGAVVGITIRKGV